MNLVVGFSSSGVRGILRVSRHESGPCLVRCAEGSAWPRTGPGRSSITHTKERIIFLASPPPLAWMQQTWN